jgi:uracil phosphoribosyltransferase
MVEAIVVLGGVIVTAGAIWTVLDLLRDSGIEPRQLTCKARQAAERSVTRADQACSAFRSRDISSSTACRAGLSQCRIS